MTSHWVKLDYARILSARKLLAARSKKGQFIQKYVDAAEIILAGQVYETSAVEGMNMKTLSFPSFLSGKSTVVLGYMEDFLENNTEGEIANDIGKQVFEAIAEGTLPSTAAELVEYTKSPY
ncbi:MAG: hypothetical protein ACRYFS_18435 [Janthinobacterium lividum]